MSGNVSLDRSSHDGIVGGSDFDCSSAAVHMQCMTQQQMMNSSNFLPFVVPNAYEMMIKQQQSYLRNRDSSGGEDSLSSSPLNLQTSGLKEEQKADNEADNIFPSHSLYESTSNKIDSSNMASFVNQSNVYGSSHMTPQRSGSDLSLQHDQSETLKPDVPPPPKRPLTPYMRFSKCMWQQVKTENPGLSVCEIGATIGRMWRELSNEEKQKHNDDFTLDKVRYDTELKQYLKDTGLRSRDLVKIRAKNKAATKVARRPVQSSAPSAIFKARNIGPSMESQGVGNPHFGQSFFPLGASLGMSMGMLPGFPQMWTGQQYPSQQMLASMQHFAQQQSLYLNNPEAMNSSQLSSGFNASPSNYL